MSLLLTQEFCCQAMFLHVLLLRVKLVAKRLIGIHITCTTDTAHTLTHPTLLYNIFTSTLGTNVLCLYRTPGSRAVPADTPFHFTLSTVGAVFGAIFRVLFHP